MFVIPGSATIKAKSIYSKCYNAELSVY